MKKFAVFGVFVSVLSVLLLFGGKAFAATKTWTGTAGDHKFSTGANWGGSAPSNGDDLVFPNSVSDLNPENDQSSASFASITFSGSGGDGFSITGNAFTLTGNITISASQAIYTYIDTPITLSGDKSININEDYILALAGDISGSGNITKSGTGYLYLWGNNGSHTGSIVANAGNIALDSSSMPSAGTTVNDGAYLWLADCLSSTYDKPITLIGGSEGDLPKLIVGATCSGGGGDEDVYGHFTNSAEHTITGALNLGSNVTVDTYGAKVTFSGAISGAYTVQPAEGSSGSVILSSSSNSSATPNGTYMASPKTETLSDSNPSQGIRVYGNTVVIVTGSRGNVFLQNTGATLKGTGTVGTINAQSGTKVAPGLSPGCLNSGDITFSNGSIYEVELGGTTACTNYDQLRVTGTVNLGSATLTSSLYNNFKPAKGNSFTIIDNDGTDVITGTFANLAEGATFSISGYVFKISYVGGTGNDVVLTVQSVPVAPDTGTALLRANPLVSLVVASVCAGGILSIARRQKRLSSK